MRLIPFLLRRSPGGFALAALAGAASGLCSTALIMQVNATLHGDPAAGAPGGLWFFVGLCLMLPVTLVASEHLLARIAESAVRELRIQLARRVLASPLRQLEELGSHRLLVALTHDVDMIAGTLVLVPVLFIHSALILSCLVYLGWLAPRLLLAVLTALVLGAACYQLPLLWARRRLQRARQERDVLYDRFEGLSLGVKELKLHQRRRWAFLDLLDLTNDRLRRLNVSAATLFSAGRGWGMALFFLAVGMLIFGRVEAGGASRATVASYVLVLLFMLTPLQGLLAMIPQLGRASVALRQVRRLGLSLEAEAEDEAQVAEAPAPDSEAVELVGATYTHGGKDRRAFRVGPIDLVLRPGEMVFLTGGNGSGKTTLAKVILGLYELDGGAIRVGGRELRTAADREAYRQLFAAVFADFYLFESFLGLDRTGLERDAAGYLERLQLSGKVEIRDGKLSTRDLSQGQRKRLALLCAYLEDRPFYVFDEWAAEQDPAFREIFYLEMLPELKARGKAVLVISHDDRYFRIADRIVKLDDGRIVYDGGPAGLPGFPPAAGAVSGTAAEISPAIDTART